MRHGLDKVPPEHHPISHEALPPDPRVETLKMFGGVAAKVNGHIFAGLFGRSVMIWLPEPERAEALVLEGAGPFDPMGDGRPRSDKVMLPEAMMEEPAESRPLDRARILGDGDAAGEDADSGEESGEESEESGEARSHAARALRRRALSASAPARRWSSGRPTTPPR